MFSLMERKMKLSNILHYKVYEEYSLPRILCLGEKCIYNSIKTSTADWHTALSVNLLNFDSCASFCAESAIFLTPE